MTYKVEDRRGGIAHHITDEPSPALSSGKFSRAASPSSSLAAWSYARAASSSVAHRPAGTLRSSTQTRATQITRPDGPVSLLTPRYLLVKCSQPRRSPPLHPGPQRGTHLHLGRLMAVNIRRRLAQAYLSNFDDPEAREAPHH